MKLSILICTLETRKALFDVLLAELKKQSKGYKVEILSDCDNGEQTIGAKRNKLLQKAKGDYICYIDDDDWVDSEYISKIMEALERNPDCVQLIGVMNTNGFNTVRFDHSINYGVYSNHNGIYYRPPNHLNPIRREIAQKFDFPESDFGEDTDWALQIRDSGLLKEEEPTFKVLYHYRYKTNK